MALTNYAARDGSNNLITKAAQAVAANVLADLACLADATTGNMAGVDATSLTLRTSNLAAGTPVTKCTTGAAAQNDAALPAVAAKTNYLSGFQVTGAGATGASVITVTVVGILGGTLTYFMAIPAGATAAVTPLVVTFNPPIPASAVNTAITVTVPSFGAGNLSASTVAHGYVV
jgi:hypothetical protein